MRFQFCFAYLSKNGMRRMKTLHHFLKHLELFARRTRFIFYNTLFGPCEEEVYDIMIRFVRVVWCGLALHVDGLTIKQDDGRMPSKLVSYVMKFILNQHVGLTSIGRSINQYHCQKLYRKVQIISMIYSIPQQR